MHRALALVVLSITAPGASLLAQQAPSPRDGVVPLPCAEGWQASLVLDRAEVGIWTVKAFQIFPSYGTPEVVGLDDKGRCWILVHYSGKWTPLSTIEEGEWLGGLDHGDVDPRAPGAELYTGGKKGNLYQVRAYPFGATDHRLIARFPGEEVHTLLAGDFDPRAPGSEVLVFTSPGALYRVTPTGPDGTFETAKLGDTPGRVRDALVLPRLGSEPSARIATVARSGELSVLSIGADGPKWSVVHAVPVGRGRLALAPARKGRGTVLYTTQDDGVILRHEERGEAWHTETIYRGPLGPRGVKAGHFDVDPDREQVLVFGYSGAVELLSRDGDKWRAESIFKDRAGGHWLDTLEIDSRNSTDEIIGSGYGGRIFMLSRPPGYGTTGGAAVHKPEPPAAPTKPAVSDSATSSSPLVARAPPGAPRAGEPSSEIGRVRSLFVSGSSGNQRLDPLRYRGGFQAKTAVHETLVQRDEAGRIAPGLAARWEVSADGLGYTFVLREGAHWHDGAPVTASDVAAHFRRVVGHPEHAWLRGLDRVAEVSAVGASTVRFTLREPWALLPDLCAINPCAVRGPGTLDREGEYVRAIGSGPWRFREALDDGRIVLETTTGAPRTLELTSISAPRVLGVESNAALDALRAGAVDVLADGWNELVPRASMSAADVDAGVAVSAPGSSVWYVGFALSGATASRVLRRALAAAIDREALVRDVEGGHADPCRGWAAPGVTAWPAAQLPPALSADELAGVPRSAPLRFVAADGEREAALARALTAQLRAAGFDVQLEVLAGSVAGARVEAGEFDLRLERTWGVPYDPDLSLQARFLPPTAAPSAAEARDIGVDATLRALVTQHASTADEARRADLATRIQRRIEQEAPLVPLYVPRLLALARPGATPPGLSSDLYRTQW